MDAKKAEKVKNIEQLYQNTINNVGGSGQDWKNFLDTSNRLYKYSFSDHVLIHAQNPEATACATMEVWNKGLRRWVKKGSKGIALLNYNGPESKLQYVFDIKDTQPSFSNQKPEPKKWEYKKERHERAVSDILKRTYDTESDNLDEQIVEISQNISRERYEEYANISPDNAALEKLLYMSVIYSVNERCGIDNAGINPDDFDGVSALSNDDIVALGVATSQCSKELLINIERTVKICEKNRIPENEKEQNNRTERRDENEEIDRTRIRDNGTRISDAGTGNEGTKTDRAVRIGEERLHAGTPEGEVLPNADAPRPERVSGGHRRDGGRESESDNHDDSGEETGPGQDDEPDGVGAVHEQREGDSGRNGAPGADIHPRIEGIKSGFGKNEITDSDIRYAMGFDRYATPTQSRSLSIIEHFRGDWHNGDSATDDPIQNIKSAEDIYEPSDPRRYRNIVLPDASDCMVYYAFNDVTFVKMVNGREVERAISWEEYQDIARELYKEGVYQQNIDEYAWSYLDALSNNINLALELDKYLNTREIGNDNGKKITDDDYNAAILSAATPIGAKALNECLDLEKRHFEPDELEEVIKNVHKPNHNSEFRPFRLPVIYPDGNSGIMCYDDKHVTAYKVIGNEYYEMRKPWPDFSQDILNLARNGRYYDAVYENLRGVNVPIEENKIQLVDETPAGNMIPLEAVVENGHIYAGKEYNKETGRGISDGDVEHALRELATPERRTSIQNIFASNLVPRKEIEKSVRLAHDIGRPTNPAHWGQNIKYADGGPGRVELDKLGVKLTKTTDGMAYNRSLAWREVARELELLANGNLYYPASETQGIASDDAQASPAVAQKFLFDDEETQIKKIEEIEKAENEAIRIPPKTREQIYELGEYHAGQTVFLPREGASDGKPISHTIDGVSQWEVSIHETSMTYPVSRFYKRDMFDYIFTHYDIGHPNQKPIEKELPIPGIANFSIELSDAEEPNTSDVDAEKTAITREEIEKVLRYSISTEMQREEILNILEKGTSIDDQISYRDIGREIRNSHSICGRGLPSSRITTIETERHYEENNTKLSTTCLDVVYARSGVQISRKTPDAKVTNSQYIPWDKAAEYIHDMHKKGRYAPYIEPSEELRRNNAGVGVRIQETGEIKRLYLPENRTFDDTEIFLTRFDLIGNNLTAGEFVSTGEYDTETGDTLYTAYSDTFETWDRALRGNGYEVSAYPMMDGIMKAGKFELHQRIADKISFGNSRTLFEDDILEEIRAYAPPQAAPGRANEPEAANMSPGVNNEPQMAAADASVENGDDEDGAEPERLNYQITDDSHGAGGGAKTRFRQNIEAIRTLKGIEAENRLATPREQKVLARYVGWGGLPQAFDKNNESWAGEYEELKGALTEKEYNSARGSTLNAHYTSPVVIKNIYDTLGRMGFEGGNILEPAMGTGNFFGMLPESMGNSKLYGVELDPITGRIGKQLYQNANIVVDGYEKTKLPDSFFDVAVGNVPFGSYKVADRKYDKDNFLIHDYFFAKTLDKVRPGGVVAFVTSKGTMDKQNPKVRKYIAERAELLGAVRLPNTAFKDNANTEVTTDILFLQRRSEMQLSEPDWIRVNHGGDVPVNQYFADNPDMMLGKMVFDKSMYGNEKETTCEPFENSNLGELLSVALSKIEGNIQTNELSIADIDDLSSEEANRPTIPADPRVKNFSYALVNDEVYYRENSAMYQPEMPKASLERIKGLVELRETVNSLIQLQLDNANDESIEERQKELNDLYDGFTSKFGLINDRQNERALQGDSSYYLLSTLEVLNEDGGLERKADMFTKRTISNHIVADRVGMSDEALAISISEKAKVDMEYMMGLTGFSEAKICNDLNGAIFKNPERPKNEEGKNLYEAADEYLSGNVRRKLEIARAAAEDDPETYAGNVAALEQNQPKELTAQEIDVRLGAPWVKPKYIEQFIKELLEPEVFAAKRIHVEYAPINSSWCVEGGKSDFDNVKAFVTYGTGRMSAYKIIEESLNLRDALIYDRVTDSNGNEHRVVNGDETSLAQQKQELIKNEFRNWVFRDPDRRDDLAKTYNEKYNSEMPRKYDGSHITFSGMNPDIELMSHQKNAVARVMYGGNTLLAHEVGAGKTFEMIASAMESKRLGLCQKPLFVVPNHLTEQTAAELLRLYPSANVLVATKKDFETENRRKFCSRIATGEYDGVIIGHSQFEKIPLTKERQQDMIDRQIDEITDAIEEMKEDTGSRYTVKQLEKSRKNLEAKLNMLNAEERKDDVICFEQLGVDRLYVDEAHNFKNLFLYTKIQNVAGIPQTASQKSTDMYMKTQYMDELTGGKGVIFATGTPVSNSMAEMYTMMRYLQTDKLKEKGLGQFDAWAATFGETQTAIELAPEGTGFRAKTRFSRFYNLPEMMAMFSEVADIKTADVLDLVRPEVEFHNVAVPPSPEQEDLVQDLSERASAVHERKVEPTEDNMLKITTDGRKIGLDQRLINDMLPDRLESKVNACINNVKKIWEDTKEKKLTQLIFCDFSTPGKGKFNVYDDIKTKLVKDGVPANEIAFIHDYDTAQKKEDLFKQVRSGSVRVLLGSTQKMGTGTNVQDKLIAIHDLDCPWRPADLEQRLGRIMRQGNQNKNVHCYRYVTEKTFDAYLYQTLENKQKFIGQVMTSKTPLRSCEDIDATALNFAEIKSLCAGDERIREKMTLDIEVRKLRSAESSYLNSQYDLEDRALKFYPKIIQSAEKAVEEITVDIEHIKQNTNVDNEEKFSPMVLGAKTFAKAKEAGQELLEFMQKIEGNKTIQAGNYRGLNMAIYHDYKANSHMMELRREPDSHPYTISLGNDEFGNITRINNEIKKMPERVEYQKSLIKSTQKNLEEARKELEKPFEYAGELEKKSARLAELNIALNLDRNKVNVPENENASPEASEQEAEKRLRAQWKEEVGKMRLVENAFIHGEPRPGPYKNLECVHSNDEYCVLRLGLKTLLIHEQSRMPERLSVGDKVNMNISSDRDIKSKVEYCHYDDIGRAI